MSTVKRIDGTFVDHITITDIKEVGEEGSKSGTAIIEGVARPVYKEIIDGFTTIWDEQLTDEEYEAWKARKA